MVASKVAVGTGVQALCPGVQRNPTGAGSLLPPRVQARIHKCATEGVYNLEASIAPTCMQRHKAGR